MCLAQGHNTVTPVRLEPSAPRSSVKHSTTEPLCSLLGRNEKETEEQQEMDLFFVCLI